MALTPTQEKLQFQQGKDIETILKDALESRRGQKHLIARVAFDLGLTDATVYQWCREFGINIDEYRRQTVDAEKAGQESRAMTHELTHSPESPVPDCEWCREARERVLAEGASE